MECRECNIKAPMYTWNIPYAFPPNLSYLEQICQLLDWINELKIQYDNFVSRDEFITSQNEQTTQLESEILQQREEILFLLRKEIKELQEYLEQLIKRIQKSNLSYDVTKGSYSPTKYTMRNLYNFLSVHAMTINQFNKLNKTVTQLADGNLNCWGLAVWCGNEYEGNSFIPDGVHYGDTPWTIGNEEMVTYIRYPISVDVFNKAQVSEEGFIMVEPLSERGN